MADINARISKNLTNEILLGGSIMFEHIKERIVKNLIAEVECLDAGDLEIVGNHMVSIMEDQRFIHHGLNKDHKPSGYTVDSFSPDSSIIVECSTENGYFQDYVENNLLSSYKKIRKDVRHALKHVNSSQIKKIYLVCNQLEPPSFRARFNKTDIYLENKEQINILDSRQIAEIIYQQSKENPSYADFYRQYFPNFSQELDNYEYYGKIPVKCENYYSEPAILQAITSHFAKRGPICILHGVSGAGKTQAVIDYVHSNKNNFANYIWITGDDWKENTSLSAVQRTRGGAPINVAGLFNNSKTILIIDNIKQVINKGQFNELESGFKKGGVVLATSQLSVPNGDYYLPIPPFSQEVALNILGEISPPSELTRQIIEKCRYSPLILATARIMVESQGVKRVDLYREILEAPSELMGPDGSSMIRTILEKLEKRTLQDLKKVASTELTVFDIDFLRNFTSILSCNNLQQMSIVMMANTPGIVKIHDLICTAIRDQSNYEEVVIAVEKYIADKNGEMTTSVLRQIYLTCSLILEYKKEHPGLDWLTYALLQVEGDKKYELICSIYPQNFTAEMPLSNVICLIEAKELHGYTISDKEPRREYYKACAKEFETALLLYHDIDRKTELYHHLGKALRRCQEYDAAYNTFLKLLKIRPSWHATYGQIVALGTLKVSNTIKEAGKKYMKLLLEDMLNDAASVPLRVCLAAITKLRSYTSVTKEVINNEQKVDQIAQIIASAALENIGQFFEGFVAFSSIFGYHYGKNCVALAEDLPEIITVTPEMVEARQWVNACEALANIATSAQREGKDNLRKILLDKSIAFADSVALQEHINSYEARAIAKTYNRCNMPSKALEIISKVPIKNQDHWLLYRKAEAEMMLKSEDALKTAEQAYELLQLDKKNGDRAASYLELISKCQKQSGNTEKAVEILSKAIEACADPKYKMQLQQSLSVF